MGDDIIIKNEIEKKPNWRVIVPVSIVLSAIVVVAIVVTIQFVTRRRDVVWIKNINELGYDIPRAAQEEFGGYLYHLLRQHFEVPEDGSEIVANARPETFRVTSSDDPSGVAFILDVEDYEQTFNSSINWSNTVYLPESVRIECTTKAISKYPDVMCYGMSTTSDSIQLYLPGEFSLDSGQKVKLEYGFTTSEGNDIIDVKVESCGNEAIDEKAVAGARLWVDAQNIEDEGIVYRPVSLYENCILKGKE